MSKLESESRSTDPGDIFDNLALRAEVVTLRKLLDHCQSQISTMKEVIAAVDEQVRLSDEGHDIIKGYMDNIYKRIHHIEETTELMTHNDTCYRKIMEDIAPVMSYSKNSKIGRNRNQSNSRGNSRIQLPPIDEVFRTSPEHDG